MSRSSDVMVRGLSRERIKLLLSRGVPGQDMIPKKLVLSIEESIVKMEPNIARVLPKGISVQKQIKALHNLMDHPIKNAVAVGIGSFPTDLRAKYLAITIMNAAVDAYLDSKKYGRGMPLWHRVYGGLGDSLRDKPIQEMPSMLIISNVNDGSSSFKLEKVRDLLEKFSDIPRIVITGGEPPCDLFANKLHFPMRAGFYIGPGNMVRDV